MPTMEANAALPSAHLQKTDRRCPPRPTAFAGCQLAVVHESSAALCARHVQRLWKSGSTYKQTSPIFGAQSRPCKRCAFRKARRRAPHLDLSRVPLLPTRLGVGNRPTGGALCASCGCAVDMFIIISFSVVGRGPRSHTPPRAVCTSVSRFRLILPLSAALPAFRCRSTVQLSATA